MKVFYAAYHMLQFIDADVFLTSSSALDTLIGLKRAVVAPMLASDGLYSNFWYELVMIPDWRILCHK